MKRKVKKSTIVAGTDTLATAGAAGITASAVVGGSAAAITSGMATIGSVVGGGMAAGAVITAAAPFAIVGAVAYGIFKVFED